MCKDCRYYTETFTEQQLRVDLERYKKPHEYSDYPGKFQILKTSIEDKETISAIIIAAEKYGYDDVVKLGKFYADELQHAIFDCLGLSNNLTYFFDKTSDDILKM